MKKFLLVILLVTVFLSFVSAGYFSVFTGKVIEEVGVDVSEMSEDEVLALYNENKDLVEEVSEEKVIELYEENKNILDGDLINNMQGGFDDFSNLSEENLGFLLNFVSCSLIKNVFESEGFEIEIPEDVPIKDEVIVLFLDEAFLATVRIEDKKVSGLICMEPDESRFRVFVSSDLILKVVLNKDEINPTKFIKESLDDGSLKIEAKGIWNRLRLFVVKIGLKFI